MATHEHDHGYKLLFSHAKMIEELLRGFVHEDWVELVDFSTLERRNASYVTDDLRERHDDVIWRVRLRDQWLYVYLLIEFQSEVDRLMAIRIMTYLGLLYQDLARAGEVAPGGCSLLSSPSFSTTDVPGGPPRPTSAN